MSDRSIEIGHHGAVVVAPIQGDIDLANTPTVSAKVLESVPNYAVGLVVDLSAVATSTASVSMLFTFVRSLHASRQGIAIALRHGSPSGNC